MDWQSVDWNSVGNGLLILVVGLLATLGKRQGDKNNTSTAASANSSGHASMALAGALVDNGSVDRHTAALEAFNMTFMSAQINNKEMMKAFTASMDRMAESLQHSARATRANTEEMEKIRRELHEQFMFGLKPK